MMLPQTGFSYPDPLKRGSFFDWSDRWMGGCRAGGPSSQQRALAKGPAAKAGPMVQ